MILRLLERGNKIRQVNGKDPVVTQKEPEEEEEAEDEVGGNIPAPLASRNSHHRRHGGSPRPWTEGATSCWSLATGETPACW